MALLIYDEYLEQQILQDRRERHIDQQDEVWDGVRIIYPPWNVEHRKLVSEFLTLAGELIVWTGLGKMYPGVIVSDQRENWQRNYRCPDFAVYRKENRADPNSTHYYGGPDLAVEITSPYDKAREKLDFYAQVNTREVLILDRDPWSLELYQLEEKKLVLKGTSTAEKPETLELLSVPVTMRMQPGEPRPQILVAHQTEARTWTI